MLMDRIKNWLKLLALWAWVHFISLLASDPDSVPKLKYVTEEDGIIILADETTDGDKIKTNKKKKSVKDLNEENKEEVVCKHLEINYEERDYLDNEEISYEEKDDKFAENESLDKSQLEDKEEKEEKEEEFDIPWLGVGRGTGLTRYSGIQNLLDTNNTAEEPLVVEKRPPVLIPRRDGPLVLQRPSFGRSLSHEKERLSEIPEEEKQSPPSFNDEVSNDSDKLWASLVARYGKEEEKEKNNVQNEISGKNDLSTDVEVLQQTIFTSPDESISSEEFSTQVEERLQRYLSKIDEQKLLDESSMKIENFVDETETMDREIEEINEYEVDSETFDQNGRLGNENEILILIEDDDSNEEKEETLDKKCDKEEIMPDDYFYDENFEMESKEDNKRLKAIHEEEEDEAISDYDDIQFDSKSNFKTIADTYLATEFQPPVNKDQSSATILDSELMPLAVGTADKDDTSDHIKLEDDYYQYQENTSDEEEVIEEEIPAVFTISLRKKPDTSLPLKNDDDTSTLESATVLNRESPILEQVVSNKTDLPNLEKEVESVNFADKKVDSSCEFYTNERRQSRDLWKMDCDKMLGEQESPHIQSLEEREDFIFTTYDEFPEDCVPVAEGLLAITEKFGIPLDAETPKDEEEENDSIVDDVFEEPKVPVDKEEFDIFFSKVVPNEESVDQQTDPDFYENLKYNYFIPEIETQEEELITANLDKIFHETSELETNRITDLPDVTEPENLATTVEELQSNSINLELKNVNTDQVNVDSVQYDKTLAGLEFVNIMTQEAYAIDSMDGNIEKETVEKAGMEVLKSSFGEMETSIEVEPIREQCPLFVKLETNMSASMEDGKDFSVTLLEGEQIDKDKSITEMDIDIENATSSEYILETVVKEKPVLNIMHHGLSDVAMDDSNLETTESLSHFMLEAHAESKLDDSWELETLKESKQVQILEQMKEEEPARDTDSVTAKCSENKSETENSDASVNFADKEKSSVYLENLDSEKFNNALLNETMKEISQDKETMSNILSLNEPGALTVDKSYKQNESLPELPSNEQAKKTVAKVKKGKLDNILKRFEEKEEPQLKKPLPKKRFEVKVEEAKPTMEGIKNIKVKDNEISAQQKANSSTLISAFKNELAENATKKASNTESLLPTAMEVDKTESCREETSVINQNKNIPQTDQVMIKDDKIFSTENISTVVQEITAAKKPSEKQSAIVNILTIDSSNVDENEKLKDVNKSVSNNEEICVPEKMEVVDSLCSTNKENFESSSKQAETIESASSVTSVSKIEVTESVAVDPPSDNIVTVTIPRRKKLLIPKNFEEISEPKKIIKIAVKKGKLDNILKRFEDKECQPIATKALPKLDSNLKAFVKESKDLEVSLNSQLPEEVHDEKLKTASKEPSFPVEDGNKEMEIVICEKQASTLAEAVDEHMRFEHENVKNLKTPALDSAKECLLASLESSTVQEDLTVKFREESEATAPLTPEAGTFIKKELNKNSFEVDLSDKSFIEKEFLGFNVKDNKTLLNKQKSTSLLELGPEKSPEQIVKDEESYYVLDETQRQPTSLSVEDVDVDKEKSYWFDDSKNLREAESLHERITTDEDKPSYWFEEDASKFWFEEEVVSNKGNETFADVDSLEIKKRHSYFSEEDDDLYFLKKTDTEKPFNEEKDEELALLRKETMELSKPKKIKKDNEDTELVRESSYTGNLKSVEISEEDRLEKERILCAIRKEREGSKSGVIPDDEIPDYLDDVKDLLVPKVRRKKGRKSRALDDLMKVEEPDFTPKAMEKSKKELNYEQPLTTENQANVASECAFSVVKEDSESVRNKFLTVEEERELIVIHREQEALRASQRKELEKYLSMPAALTEQEQNELEELLAEEETDRTVNAVSEARLEALLNEVRKRIGDSELDLETAAALEEYIGLPIGLSAEEELLLSNIGEEKDRSQFASDDEYRDYIKQRYLDELEDERMRVEEDEYEFGGYYEDDYDYEGDEDYDEEYMEEDYDMMVEDNTPLTPTMKDEAVGGDEPMNVEMEDDEEGVELKKSKNLLSSLSSLRSKGSKSSSVSLDKQGSNHSSKEGSSSDLKESPHTQSKKFFRYGGLSIKRKKKSKDYSEIDPGIKKEWIDTNDVSDNANIVDHSKSLSVENVFNENEDNCSSDEAFVMIPKDICKSITNLWPHESVEIALCQDFPVNKIDSSSVVISSFLINEHNSNEFLAQKSDHIGKVSKMSEVTSGPDAMDEEELWPEEGDGKKEELDEFQKMEQEVEREMEEEQKKKKKSDTDKKGKKKKKRKGESEKENKKTAYQSKDELYEKHVGPRIRSFDAAKMKSKFNKPKEPSQVSNDCRICGKLVFQMEKIVAEKASWHKNCFRCTECNKNLTLETYQSHEGSLYCKPHFKELFRPKAVVQDEAEERKDRLLRRPRMIILESQPEILPDDVVRATEKPDYGLEELQTSLNVKERFAVFESYSKAADEPKLESVSVRRSQSLMSKAARFSNGHQNGDNEDEEEEEEDYESGEEMEEGEEEGGEEDPNYVKSRKKKERPMSFSGMGDLKAVWEQKQRREEMSQARKEDISKFRQMLCAGKNITLKEMFESGNFEGAEDESKSSREEIKIEDRRAAHNLKARFEKGQPFILEDEEGSEDGSRKSTLVGEKQEVEEVFKDAQTAKQARNVFKQIDSKVAQEGSVIMRSPSFAAQNRDNRRSLDRSMSTVEVVKSSEPVEEEVHMDTTDLANRFKFFATFEERQKEETEKKRKVFRITPPREGAEQGLSHGDDSDILGRDPNLIKCTDNYQDDIDCRNTKNILQMFKKMEMGEEDEEEEEGPRPLKCFTPPPEDGDGDESEYSDEEYSDEGEEEESEVDDDGKPKFKDELLEMEAYPQSARKAANLRAKFEKWEEKQNELNRDKDNELEEECRPSLDTARNLTAMFEHKAIEVTKVVTSKPVAQKINRFV